MMRLKGEQTTLSLTIQTELMRKAARFGVVLGKTHRKPAVLPFKPLCKSLNVLIDGECAKTTFSDLLDYLHQEKIHGSIPRTDIYMNCRKAPQRLTLPMQPVCS